MQLTGSHASFHGPQALSIVDHILVEFAEDLVFESPVQSGLWTPRALDRDQDQSFKSKIVKKTGPNQYGPVLVGLL
jgi:hypothetical protein